MPNDGLAKIENFVKFCEKQRNTFDFALGNIANMDETPIWADMPSKATVVWFKDSSHLIHRI